MLQTLPWVACYNNYSQECGPLSRSSAKSCSEKKYSAFDRELLAAYLGVKHFRHFLEGREFHILTDHKPHTYCLVSNTERSSPRQVRHLAFIAEFTCDIRHMSGSNNVAADALSRMWLNALGQAVNLDYDALAKAQETDSDLRHCIDKPGGLRLRYLEFAFVKSPIWYDVSTGKPRLFVPQDICRVANDLLHNLSHPGGRATRKLVSARFVWPKMNSTITVRRRRLVATFHRPCSLDHQIHDSTKYMSTQWTHSVFPRVSATCLLVLIVLPGGRRLYQYRTFRQTL